MVNWGLTLKGKPKANFRLLGPPGVGKTEICNAFTDYLLGEDKLVRFDMSEYQTLESIYRLLGHNGEEGLLGLNYDRVDGSVTLLFAVFAIKPVGTCGDVKTRLWSGVRVTALVPDLSIKCDESSSCYPWKLAIVATVFWIGETGSGPTNRRSAWDTNWVSNYGGVDDPVRRRGYEPTRFRPFENPFYVALPYCDMVEGLLKPEAAKVVPWFISRFRGPHSSVCKGHWVEIRHGAKICYAQWEDVGPFCTDSAGYVFSDERPVPNVNHGAGIDVSPAVRDCLGLGSLGSVDWRFVEEADVSAGPWSLYANSTL